MVVTRKEPVRPFGHVASATFGVREAGFAARLYLLAAILGAALSLGSAKLGHPLVILPASEPALDTQPPG